MTRNNRVSKQRMNNHLRSLCIILLCSSAVLLSFTESAAAAGWIIVHTPSSGGTWYTGDTLAISWSSADAGSYLTIELYYGSSLDYSISTSAYNSGVYQWVVPSSISSGSLYRIQISSNDNSSISDFSEYFSIQQRSLSLSQPESTDVWYTGQSYGIAWVSTNVYGYVHLYVYKGDTLVDTAGYNVYTSSGGNQYYWTVSDSLASGTNYRIRIVSQSYSGVEDYSDYFTIIRRAIHVTAPTDDSVWYLGETYQIAWDSEEAGDLVDIQLYEKRSNSYDFQYLLSIAAQAANDGLYSWTVPSTLTSSSSYRVFIRSKSYFYVNNYSAAFSVEERYIRVVAPTGSETWYGGDTHMISWVSKNAGSNVTIDLYQGGTQVAVLALNISNTGEYVWSIPSSISADESSQIKIKSSSIATLYGLSATFSLQVKSITVTSPAEDALWYKGDMKTIIWESHGFSSSVDIELYAGATIVTMIAHDVDNTGSYQWRIPDDLAPASTYKVKISSIVDSDVYAYTNTFTIESTFLQQWSGAIALFSAVCLLFIFVYIFIIRRWRKRIAEESGAHEITAPAITPETLNPEEYEAIWEHNRD